MNDQKWDITANLDELEKKLMTGKGLTGGNPTKEEFEDAFTKLFKEEGKL